MSRFSTILGSGLAALLLAPLASAQLSGTKTINPNGSGSNNYKSFAAAATALRTSGVNGPVTFAVSAGTHVESWSLDAVPGVSATNTITFTAGTPGFLKLVKLHAGAASQNIVTLNGGVAFVRFVGLAFGNCSSASAIQSLYNSTTRLGVNDVIIEDCVFESSLVPAAKFGALRTQSTRNWVIRDSVFETKGTSLYSQGAYNLEISRNKFVGQGSAYCLSMWNSNRSQCRVFNNEFTGSFTTYVVRCALSHYQIDFWHNTFNVSTNGWLFQVSSCCTVAWNSFYNNIYAIKGTGGVYSLYTNRDIESNYNLFFLSGPIGRIGNSPQVNLTAWAAALGAYAKNGGDDSKSVIGNPQFVSATDLRLKTSSAALGKALPKPKTFTAAGHEVMADFKGLVRGSAKDIGAYELAGWKEYGAGCAGTGNAVPRFEIGGDLAPGSAASFELSNGRGNATCLLAAGLNQLKLPFGTGCEILTNPLLFFLLRTDAAGKASLKGSVPNNVAIVGALTYFQMGVDDPVAAAGIAFSQGVIVQL